MARTKITGKQIAPRSLKYEHISEDTKIPEDNLSLNYPTHSHNNKAAIDVLVNSNPAVVKTIDLLEIQLVLQDIINSRDIGKTLSDTIKARALKSVVDEIEKDIQDFKGDKETLKSVLDDIYESIKGSLNNHKGIITHKELDLLHSDVINSRGGFGSLAERLSNMEVGEGSGGAGGSCSDVWMAETSVKAGARLITTPNNYDINSESLFVYEGPLLLTKGVDYFTVDNSTIELMEPLGDDTTFKFIGTEVGKVYEWNIRVLSTEGESNISTMYKYTPNLGQLDVYEDGVLLCSGVDYNEVDQFNIKLNYDIPTGCVLSINKRR